VFEVFEHFDYTPGERWAREQNADFVRALDVAFPEMNVAAVSPVFMFDVALIGLPSKTQLRSLLGM